MHTTLTRRKLYNNVYKSAVRRRGRRPIVQDVFERIKLHSTRHICTNKVLLLIFRRRCEINLQES
jgi:hypothetical protein